MLHYWSLIIEWLREAPPILVADMEKRNLYLLFLSYTFNSRNRSFSADFCQFSISTWNILHFQQQFQLQLILNEVTVVIFQLKFPLVNTCVNKIVVHISLRLIHMIVVSFFWNIHIRNGIVSWSISLILFNKLILTELESLSVLHSFIISNFSILIFLD